MQIDTSREVYEKKVLPNLTKRQKKVFIALDKLGAASSQQIADHLNLPINFISGRVLELREAGFVIGAVCSREGF